MAWCDGLVNAARDLVNICKTKGLRVTTAESCTGGMVSVALTDIAGSSAVFDRGFVTYTNAAKIDLLGVQKPTLDAVGAVSQDVAQEMALGALANSKADIAVSVTGIAGPGDSDFKPEGRVCFGIAFCATGATCATCDTETVEFGALGRKAVRGLARNHALALLLMAASKI